jgi:hypothetical protein
MTSPDQPTEPGLLVLIAVAVLGLALFATAGVALIAVLHTAGRRIHHRLTRNRRVAAHYAAAIARVRAGHDPAPDGTCNACHVTWPCPLLCRLAGPPCSPTCEDRHPTPAAAPPRPYRDVIATAVEDWWLTTDPAQDRNTGAEIAAYVDMYLTSSGYHITPNP